MAAKKTYEPVVTEKAQAAIDAITERFKDPASLEYLTQPITFQLEGTWATETYSYANKVLVQAQLLTLAARTLKQWNALGHKVNKGAPSAWVWQPQYVMAEKKKKDTESAEPSTTPAEKPQPILRGFRTFNVIAAAHVSPEVEVTFKRRELPLIEVAEQLGIHVTAMPLSGAFGYYQRGTAQIVMGTQDTHVWLHELCHAIHDKTCPDFKWLNKPIKEMVAEMGSAVLLSYLGYKIDKSIFDYCNWYAALYEEATKRKIAEHKNVPPIVRNLQLVLPHIQRIMDYIIKFGDQPVTETQLEGTV